MLKIQRLLVLALLTCLLLAVGCSAVDTGAQTPSGQQEEPESGATREGGVAEGDFQASGNENLSVAWILSKATAQADNRALDGFKSYIGREGLDWDVNVSDAKGSPAEAADLLENVVERDVDVIILSMTDLRASKAAIESANEAGIPIFTVDSGWTEGVVVDVTSNNYVMSGKVSSYLVDRLGGKGNIVALKENTHHGVRKRGEILDVVVEENPGIKVIAEHNIDPTNFFEDSRQATEDFLTRHGTDIDAVWAGWDEPAQAAADAIKAAGYTREDMFVVGIDGHPSAIEEIRSDSPFVATVAQAFEQMGSLTAEYVQKTVVEGRPVNEVIPSTTVYLESPLITPENLPEKGELPWKAPDFYESGS